MTTMQAGGEHILVCLSSAPSNANIIRTAAKMSAAFGGSFTALYVKTKAEEHLPADDRNRLQAHISLAEENGASIVTVAGEDAAYQIAEFARLEKVTKVVLGRSATAKGHLLSKKPLTEKLIELAPHLDVFIIPDMAGDNRHPPSVSAKAAVPALRDLCISLLMLLLTTGVGFLFEALQFSSENIMTGYILGVLIAALFIRSYVCNIINSLLSVVLFNFLFTEPRLSLLAYASGYPVTFAVMLLSSLITGTLANRVADHAKQSVQSASRTKALFEMNQLLQKANGSDEILQVTATQLMKLLNRELVLYPNVNGRLGDAMRFSPEDRERDTQFGLEMDIAQWVLTHKRRAGATTDVHSDAKGLYLAIRSGGTAYGVVGIHVGEKPLEPFVSSVLLSILGECALALENNQNAREKEEAAVMARNEQLRANLLRAISHDLRTPLTSISGNAENLLANGDMMDAESRKQIASDIYDDAIWLIQLVENLLSITRISEGRMQLHLSAQLVEEVIEESLRHIGRKGSGHHITAVCRDELMLARMDARLISQVIINLVDNAIKYTPPGSDITVAAEGRGNMVAISVADNGPGIPDDAKQQVFDMFYTGNNRVADCRRSLGLGLSLCRSIVQAHGGEIAVKDNHPKGTIFTFTLPASEVTLNE